MGTATPLVLKFGRAQTFAAGTLIAVGDHAEGAFDYTSRDGVAWERSAMFPGTSLMGIAPAGGG